MRRIIHTTQVEQPADQRCDCEVMFGEPVMQCVHEDGICLKRPKTAPKEGEKA